jgi:hypothetical protein
MKKNTRRVIYKSNKQTRNARHRHNHKRTKTHRNINIGGTKEEERKRQIEEEKKRQIEEFKKDSEGIGEKIKAKERQNFLKENPYEETEPITDIPRKEKRKEKQESGQEQYRKYAQGMILDNKNYIDPKTTEKDLVFTISTSISIINNIEDIIDNIIKEKKEINKEKFDEDSAKEENAKLNQLFNGFKEIYNNTKDDIQNKIDNSDSTLDKNDQGKFEYIIYVYILLYCYRIAIVESRKQLAKSDVDSWWFFTAADFSNILKDLNIENIINNFMNEIQTLNPAPVPSNDDKNDDHSVNEEVDVKELRINKFGTEDQIKEYYREKQLMAINKLREEGKQIREQGQQLLDEKNKQK